MERVSSRRLTGRSLVLDRPGAVLEVALAEGEELAVELWREKVGRLLEGVGWGGEEIAVRLFPGGASLAISAPIDSLYAATEVNEAAWDAAWKSMTAEVGGAEYPYKEEVARLGERIRAERNPRLLALRAAAEARGVAFLWDDEAVSVGLGSGSRTFPMAPIPGLPSPEAIDWRRVHDVPVALVTGTNGKTTTVRLGAAMAAAAGYVVGLTSTDRIQVGEEVLDEGDYSGPGGARSLLRDSRVEMAILETARGGLLRRGLALSRADAALVTNVAADHLGEYGILDLPSLAEVKLVVAQAVPATGRVILNADDPEISRARKSWPAPITWFSLEETKPAVLAHLAAGGEAALLAGDSLVFARGARGARGGEREEIAKVPEIPMTYGGAARHNVANALAAIGLAAALGISRDAMAAGLRTFGTRPEDNPGRAQLLERDGVRVLLDYAHNPHGLKALLGLARTLPASRRLLLLGQAGDRDDDAIRELARTAWAFHPDRVVIKELPAMLRGRPAGEVPAILEAELLRLGAPRESLERAGSEIEAVDRALAWARPGDLLILLVHTDREAVLARLS